MMFYTNCPHSLLNNSYCPIHYQYFKYILLKLDIMSKLGTPNRLDCTVLKRRIGEGVPHHECWPAPTTRCMSVPTVLTPPMLLPAWKITFGPILAKDLFIVLTVLLVPQQRLTCRNIFVPTLVKSPSSVFIVTIVPQEKILWRAISWVIIFKHMMMRKLAVDYKYGVRKKYIYTPMIKFLLENNIKKIIFGGMHVCKGRL